MKIVKCVLIWLLVITAIAVHISFMWWDRGCFAPGSEWLVYLAICIAAGYKTILKEEVE